MLASLLSVLIALGSSATGCAPELSVAATLPQDSTGTMHYAESLTIGIGDAAPLRMQAPPGAELLPLPGPCHRLGGRRFLLLGWSSSGGGMQSIQALVVAVRAGAVVRVDRLDYVSARTNAGLLVRRTGDGEVRLGVPEPGADPVHEPADWALEFGAAPRRHLSLAGLRALAFDVVEPAAGDTFYAPPLQAAPTPARVAWMAITPSGFSPVAAGG
ncbi:hypothetical protein [Tahibacter caeni]|uniref:hypothetical protein n=1 Tax=Tahibacter caeni TaxID=1453545 RepID=UPI00214738ED|nr:hypothetical protein [Tahibacter caeni]